MSIGRAVAVRFAREGAKVGLIGRRAGPLQETAQLIREAGGTCLVTPCDVSMEDQVEHALEFELGEAAAGLVGMAREGRGKPVG